MSKTLSQKMLDNFVERFIDGEYRINPDATHIICTYNGQKLNLFQFLTESINNYITAKSNIDWAREIRDENSLKKALVDEAEWREKPQVWLTHAQCSGMIIETDSMTANLNKLKQENTQLKEQITILRQLNEKLAKENKRLHCLFPDSSKGTSEYGDVE